MASPKARSGRITRRRHDTRGEGEKVVQAAAPRPQGEFKMPVGREPTTGFAIPAPKGARPRGAVVTPEEEAGRFSGNGDVQAQGKRVGGRFLSGDAVAQSQLRMRGVRQEPEDDEMPEDVDALGEGDDGDEAYDVERAELTARTNQHTREEAGFSSGDEVDEALIFGKAITKPPPPPLRPGLVLRDITVEDTDRLWDWVRADDDGGATFFGKAMTLSTELHDLMRGYLGLEKQGGAAIRSVYFVDNKLASHHLGTLVLVPILSTERIALLHLFLRQDVRPNLGNFLGPLIDFAQELVPDMRLAYFASTGEGMTHGKTLLAPLGFKPFTMFVR